MPNPNEPIPEPQPPDPPPDFPQSVLRKMAEDEQARRNSSDEIIIYFCTLYLK